jgi:hypothetical protein
MQPLDNGPFNAVKAAYQKELKKFNFNTDARPFDKINFIKAYNMARKAGLTKKEYSFSLQNYRKLAHQSLEGPSIPRNSTRCVTVGGHGRYRRSYNSLFSAALTGLRVTLLTGRSSKSYIFSSGGESEDIVSLLGRLQLAPGVYPLPAHRQGPAPWQDVEKKTPERELGPAIEHDPEVTPKTSRQVRDYGKNKSPTTRRHYNTIAKGYTKLEFELATKNDRIAALEAEVARLKKKKEIKGYTKP